MRLTSLLMIFLMCVYLKLSESEVDTDSNNPQYIMSKIREDKLEESTVTIVSGWKLHPL